MSDGNPNEPTTTTPGGDDDAEVTENDGSNAVATDDPDFIGVNEEYKNYALDVLQPHPAPEGTEERKLEDRAKEYAERMKVDNVGRHGFDVSDTVHPSKRKQPAVATIDQNRKITEKAAR